MQKLRNVAVSMLILLSLTFASQYVHDITQAPFPTQFSNQRGLIQNSTGDYIAAWESGGLGSVVDLSIDNGTTWFPGLGGIATGDVGLSISIDLDSSDRIFEVSGTGATYNGTPDGSVWSAFDPALWISDKPSIVIDKSIDEVWVCDVGVGGGINIYNQSADTNLGWSTFLLDGGSVFDFCAISIDSYSDYMGVAYVDTIGGRVLIDWCSNVGTSNGCDNALNWASAGLGGFPVLNVIIYDEVTMTITDDGVGGPSTMVVVGHDAVTPGLDHEDIDLTIPAALGVTSLVDVGTVDDLNPSVSCKVPGECYIAYTANFAPATTIQAWNHSGGLWAPGPTPLYAVAVGDAQTNPSTPYVQTHVALQEVIYSNGTGAEAFSVWTILMEEPGVINFPVIDSVQINGTTTFKDEDMNVTVNFTDVNGDSVTIWIDVFHNYTAGTAYHLNMSTPLANWSTLNPTNTTWFYANANYSNNINVTFRVNATDGFGFSDNYNVSRYISNNAPTLDSLTGNGTGGGIVDEWLIMTPTPAPTKTTLHTLTYDNETTVSVLFGGNNGTKSNETWLYNFSDNTWTYVNPAIKPPARHSHGAAYDSSSGKTFIFGGNRRDFLYEKSLWAYNITDNTWTNMYPTESIVGVARESVAMTYDVTNNLTFIYGGIAFGRRYSELWVYNHSDNVLVNLTVHEPKPNFSEFSSIVYDVKNNHILSFGGNNGTDTSNQTWVFNYTDSTWTSMGPPTAPSPRSEATLVYYMNGEKVILYGGYNGTRLSDIWEYDFSTNSWTELNPLTVPAGRAGHASSYDELNKRMIMFGGQNGGTNNETWVYNASETIQTIRDTEDFLLTINHTDADGDQMFEWVTIYHNFTNGDVFHANTTVNFFNVTQNTTWDYLLGNYSGNVAMTFQVVISDGASNSSTENFSVYVLLSVAPTLDSVQVNGTTTGKFEDILLTINHTDMNGDDVTEWVTVYHNFTNGDTYHVNSTVHFLNNTQNTTWDYLRGNYSDNVNITFQVRISDGITNSSFSNVSRYILDKEVSFFAVKFNATDFSFADTNYVTGVFENFSVQVTTDLVVMTSFNVLKSIGGGTNVITVRMKVNGSTLLEENVRTVSVPNEEGSTGTRPIKFTVDQGDHNFSMEFKRSGVGTIEINDIDINMGQFLTTLNNSVRGNITEANFTFSSQTFIPVFNWTISKTINSATFIAAKLTLQKQTTGGSDVLMFFENLLDNTNSSYWARFLDGIIDIGSVYGSFIETSENVAHAHAITAKQSDIGDTVTVNGTIIDFDMKDNSSNTVNHFSVSNGSTNLTDFITLPTGRYLLTSSELKIEDGNGTFLSMMVSFNSTSGKQTPTFFVNSTNDTAPETNCFSKKERYLSSNLDVGNAFLYTICDNLTTGETYEFNLWAIVGAGETINILDEELSGFEVTSFSTTKVNIPPIVAIISPAPNATVVSTTIIEWLTTEINNDNYLTNITINNGTEIILNTTLDRTITTDIFDFLTVANGPYQLTVESCENETVDALCGNATIWIIVSDFSTVERSEINEKINSGNNYYFTVIGNLRDMLGYALIFGGLICIIFAVFIYFLRGRTEGEG